MLFWCIRYRYACKHISTHSSETSCYTFGAKSIGTMMCVSVRVPHVSVRPAKGKVVVAKWLSVPATKRIGTAIKEYRYGSAVSVLEIDSKICM
ncbi:hypothetical protein V6N12_024324 [Hibiscus sabdariffa]|uniref:Uncharacterized protein n=1 Tax=Hibiscus sabdariffa TaxID=183260 RepID=A0ABR2G091_9ROSI